MNESMIRDINLAEEGKQRIAWVEKFMPVLNTLKEEFSADQSFKGKTVVMSIHLEAKTAYLALTLKAAGANVICTGSRSQHRILLRLLWLITESPFMHGTAARMRNIRFS